MLCSLVPAGPSLYGLFLPGSNILADWAALEQHSHMDALMSESCTKRNLGHHLPPPPPPSPPPVREAHFMPLSSQTHVSESLGVRSCHHLPPPPPTPTSHPNLSHPLLQCINVNKLTSTGVHFKFWIADWFAQLNNKMGGDLKKIQTVGKYMIEVWKAVGMDLSRVEFLSSSEEINKRPDEYWTLVMDIARKQSLKRIIRWGGACVCCWA